MTSESKIENARTNLENAILGATFFELEPEPMKESTRLKEVLDECIRKCHPIPAAATVGTAPDEPQKDASNSQREMPTIEDRPSIDPVVDEIPKAIKREEENDAVIPEPEKDKSDDASLAKEAQSESAVAVPIDKEIESGPNPDPIADVRDGCELVDVENAASEKDQPNCEREEKPKKKKKKSKKHGSHSEKRCKFVDDMADEEDEDGDVVSGTGEECDEEGDEIDIKNLDEYDLDDPFIDDGADVVDVIDDDEYDSESERPRVADEATLDSCVSESKSKRRKMTTSDGKGEYADEDDKEKDAKTEKKKKKKKNSADESEPLGADSSPLRKRRLYDDENDENPKPKKTKVATETEEISEYEMGIATAEKYMPMSVFKKTGVLAILFAAKRNGFDRENDTNVIRDMLVNDHSQRLMQYKNAIGANWKMLSKKADAIVSSIVNECAGGCDNHSPKNRTSRIQSPFPGADCSTASSSSSSSSIAVRRTASVGSLLGGESSNSGDSVDAPKCDTILKRLIDMATDATNVTYYALAQVPSSSSTDDGGGDGRRRNSESEPVSCMVASAIPTVNLAVSDVVIAHFEGMTREKCRSASAVVPEWLAGMLYRVHALYHIDGWINKAAKIVEWIKSNRASVRKNSKGADAVETELAGEFESLYADWKGLFADLYSYVISSQT